MTTSSSMSVHPINRTDCQEISVLFIRGPHKKPGSDP
jgi:hypothetical protein